MWLFGGHEPPARHARRQRAQLALESLLARALE
jgi:hypothetical protein